MAKKAIRRLVILFVIFTACLIAFSIQMNRKQTTRAASVSGASLPVAYMRVEGMTVNPMTPYRQELKESTERECLTPLTVERTVELLIEMNDNSVRDLSYQVTSLEDGSLLENGVLTDYTEENGAVSIRFPLSTAEIRNGQEYMLRISLLTGNGDRLYYYSRLVQYGAGNIREYLNFTNEFIQDATNKVTAADLGVYMEPDLAEANWSLAHITITSSTDLLSWGGLNPEIVMTMPPTILEINDINSDIRQQYVIRATDSELNEEYYTVDEYFRVTEYSGQLIIRNYQRDVAQIFDATLPIIGDSKVNLGIQPRDLKFVQNPGSTRAAFALNGDIWTYDAMTDRAVRIFTFRGKTLEGEKEVPDLDARTEFARHGVYLSGINDSGDVTFVIYGYMPVGDHEGMVGVSVYRYYGEQNRTDEILFLPLNLSIDQLQRNVSRLSYVGTGNVLYLFLGTQLCRIDLSNGSFQVEQGDIADDAFLVSGSQKQVAWTDAESNVLADTLTILNLETGVRREIRAPEGQKITGCGFIGEDIAYGLTKEQDIYRAPDGSNVGGMYTIRIESEDGATKKEYTRNGIYVMSAAVEDGNSLQLNLAVKTDKGLEDAGTEQIRDNGLSEERVQLVPISSSRTDEQMWLTFSDILLRTDPDVMTAVTGSAGESVETILEWPEPEGPQYYIYARGKLQDVETARNIAIAKAYEEAGTVLDKKQLCVWQRYNWPLTYRINLNSLPPSMLASAMSGDLQAFVNSLGSGKQLFDLSGVVTTGLFYVLSRGCPVFVQLADGTSRLLVGYDEDNLLYWDPAAGDTAEMPRKQADAIFRRGGYRFYTWEDVEKEPAAETEGEPAAEEGGEPAEAPAEEQQPAEEQAAEQPQEPAAEQAAEPVAEQAAEPVETPAEGLTAEPTEAPAE